MTTAADAAALRGLLGGDAPGSGVRRVPLSRAAKFSDELVREIREEWAAWRQAGVAGQRGAYPRGYATLGLIFGVSAETARDIVLGRTRRSAGGPIDEERRRG